jgi:hypothetical protein
VEFVYLPIFEKRAEEIGFTESDALELEVILANEPDAGDVIPGGAGLRKVRCALAGRGKSSGARVIYFYRTSNSTILLFSVFAKNEGSDVLKSYLKFLVQIVKKEIK